MSPSYKAGVMTDNSDVTHSQFSLTGVVVGTPPFSTINQLSARAAMGLPELVLPSMLDNSNTLFDRLRHYELSSLEQLLNNSQVNFCERFVAGQILALCGDPRLNLVDPPMITIPKANVKIGLNPDEVDEIIDQYKTYGVQRSWIEKESPIYEVRLESFALAQFCVTNVEYLNFLTETGYSRFPTSWLLGRYPAERANHPVYSVTSEDAENYILWLKQKTGRAYRLPTEAEWEYAASGPERFEFPWANEFHADCCNTVEAGILQTTPVGLFPRGLGPFGHADLAGNVEEYVADDYHVYPGGQAIVDDLFLSSPRYRVTRGGCFSRYRDLARTRRRHGPVGRDFYALGFRLAETIGSQITEN